MLLESRFCFGSSVWFLSRSSTSLSLFSTCKVLKNCRKITYFKIILRVSISWGAGEVSLTCVLAVAGLKDI